MAVFFFQIISYAMRSMICVHVKAIKCAQNIIILRKANLETENYTQLSI